MISERAIVVCGAGGFVGRRLVEYLVGRGYKKVRAVCHKLPTAALPVDTVIGDLRELDVARGAVPEDGSVVINLAAQVGGIGFIGQNHSECLLSSQINLNLLRACEEKKAVRYFFASSSCVYPEGGAMREDKAIPADPGSGYGWEKIFSEQVCQAFDKERRVPCTIARFHTLYGPGDLRPAGREHVIEALCKKVIRAKLSGVHEIPIWGDGLQTRSFLYIDDCVEGIYRLVNSGVSGPLNLSGRESATVNQLVDYLEEISAIKLERFYNKTAPVGKVHKMTDNTKLRESIAWEPMTPLKEGLRKTYNFLWDQAVCNPS